jgi:hypothetical protein
MILTREITAAEKRRGGDSTSEDAVDPVAHGEPAFEGLDVDVRGARVERVGDQVRDQAYDRRFRREVLEVLHVGVESQVVARLDVADDLAHRRAAAAVETLERGVELRWNRDQRPDLAPADHAERSDRVLVGRVGHRQRDLGLVLAQRQRPRLAQEPRRDALLEDGKFRISGGVDERQAELRRERLGDVALRAQPERHQQRAELLVRLLLQPQRAVETGRIELAPLDQDLADSLSRRCIHDEFKTPKSRAKSL